MNNSITALKEKFISKKSFVNFDYYIFLLQTLFYGTVVGLNSMLIPVFALQLKATPFMVGLIAGSRGIGHFAFVVPIGFLLDRYGAKKVFVYVSFIDFLIILFMAFAKSPFELLLLASFEGIACSTRLTALNGAFLNHLSHIDASISGWYKGFMNSGLVLAGPLIGGLLLNVFGMKTALIGTACLVIFTNIFIIIFGTVYSTEDNNRANKRSDSSESEGFWEILKNPRILFTTLSEGLGSGYISSFRALIVLLVVGLLKRNAATVSKIVLVLGVAYIVTVFFGSPVLKNIKTKTLFQIAFIVMIPDLLILSAANNLESLYIGAFFSGIGMGILSLGNYRMMSGIKSRGGKLAGLFTFSAGLSLAIAPMLSSFIADFINVGASFLIYIIPFVLIGIVTIFKNKKIAKISL
jgi:MFS family permease